MLATLEWFLEVWTDQGVRTLTEERRTRWAPAAGALRREVLTLAVGANTITPPTGAKWVGILLESAVSLTLKGVSGDTGIALAPGSSPVGFDLSLPLSSVTSFVIANGGSASQTITVIWA